MEMKYADDSNFPGEERSALDMLQSIAAAEKLKACNLFTNKSKTDFTHVYLAEKSETDTEDRLHHGKEEGGGPKQNPRLPLLQCGRLLIMPHTRQHRILLPMEASMPQDPDSPMTCLHLYNACVSIIMYNWNSWSATKASLM